MTCREKCVCFCTNSQRYMNINNGPHIDAHTQTHTHTHTHTWMHAHTHTHTHTHISVCASTFFLQSIFSSFLVLYSCFTFILYFLSIHRCLFCFTMAQRMNEFPFVTRSPRRPKSVKVCVYSLWLLRRMKWQWLIDDSYRTIIGGTSSWIKDIVSRTRTVD